MKEVISKELLSEVLGDDLCNYESIESISGIDEIYGNVLKYTTDENTSPLDGSYINTMREINIHELAHKCKDWAFQRKYDFEVIRIKREKDYGKIFVRIHTIHTNQCLGKEFYPFDEEPEAIFKATQWIYEQQMYDNNYLSDVKTPTTKEAFKICDDILNDKDKHEN